MKSTYHITTINEICLKIVGGGTPPTKEKHFWQGDIPWISSADISDLGEISIKRYVTIEAIQKSASNIVPKGTIIIVTRVGVGKLAIAPVDLCFSQDCQGLILKRDLADSNYCYLALKNEIFKLARKVRGATITGVTKEDLKKIKISLPYISEQIQISSILSRSETLVRQRKESLRLIDELIKSAFMEMFGDPTDNKHGFPIGTISNLVTEVKYGTSAVSSEKGQLTYLRMNNITSGGYWDFSNIKYINLPDSDKRKYTVRKGDLVFNRTNSKELVGKTAVFEMEEEMVIAGYLIRMRTNEKCNPWFIWGYLNSKHGKQTLLGLCRNIVGMANINAQELQSIKIQIPPLLLQVRFATFIEQVKVLKKQYTVSLKDLEQLYGSLSQLAFRGELDLSVVPLELPEEEWKECILDDSGPESEQSVSIKSLGEQISNMQNLLKAAAQPIQAYIKKLQDSKKILIPAWDQVAKSIQRFQSISTQVNTSKAISDSLNQYNVSQQKWATLLQQMTFRKYTFEELWEQDFERLNYDQAKEELYQWLKEGFMKQIFDEEQKKMVFSIRETH